MRTLKLQGAAIDSAVNSTLRDAAAALLAACGGSGSAGREATSDADGRGVNGRVLQESEVAGLLQAFPDDAELRQLRSIRCDTVQHM